MTLQVLIGILIRQAINLFAGGMYVGGFYNGDIINQAAGVIAAIIALGLSAHEKKAKMPLIKKAK